MRPRQHTKVVLREQSSSSANGFEFRNFHRSTALRIICWCEVVLRRQGYCSFMQHFIFEVWALIGYPVLLQYKRCVPRCQCFHCGAFFSISCFNIETMRHKLKMTSVITSADVLTEVIFEKPWLFFKECFKKAMAFLKKSQMSLLKSYLSLCLMFLLKQEIFRLDVCTTYTWSRSKMVTTTHLFSKMTSVTTSADVVYYSYNWSHLWE